MTKRSLYITILILAVLDLAAAAWWAAGYFNSDGKLRFSADDSITQADTVADVSKPDRFRLLNEYTYYGAYAFGDMYTCLMHIKAKWPVSINGDNSASELKEALIAKLFGRQYNDIKQAYDSTLANPRFCTTVGHFQRLDTRPVARPGKGSEFYYRAYPYLGSDYLLEYRVERNTYDGYNKTRQVAYVHYDRVRRQIITIDMVIDLAKKDAIISLINKRIQYHINAKGMSLRRTTNIPQEYLLGETGIVFTFQKGEIASDDMGVVEIKLGYNDLRPFLTTYFRDILAANDNYRPMPELTF